MQCLSYSQYIAECGKKEYERLRVIPPAKSPHIPAYNRVIQNHLYIFTQLLQCINTHQAQFIFFLIPSYLL